MDQRHRQLLAVGYLLALALILVPAVEVLMQATPLTPTAVRWRFGLVGFLGNQLVLPTAGVVVAVATSTFLGHRRVLKTLALFSLSAAFILTGTAALFLLDALQIRATVNPEVMKAFDAASLKAIVSMGFSWAIFLWMGWHGWKGSRSRGSKVRKDHVGLVAPTGGKPRESPLEAPGP